MSVYNVEVELTVNLDMEVEAENESEAGQIAEDRATANMDVWSNVLWSSVQVINIERVAI